MPLESSIKVSHGHLWLLWFSTQIEDLFLWISDWHIFSLLLIYYLSYRQMYKEQVHLFQTKMAHFKHYHYTGSEHF
jgi:hypothetical protein